MKQNFGRITSYNVCYTKLLRNSTTLKILKSARKTPINITTLAKDLNLSEPYVSEQVRALEDLGLVSIVITSYSIHYTKLYEFRANTVLIYSVGSKFQLRACGTVI